MHEAIRTARPEAIGVPVRNIDDQSRESPRFLLAQVKDVVDECRACSVSPIVLGGAGFSIFPHQALAFLGGDFGIVGDGEVASPVLLDRLRYGAEPSGLPEAIVPGGDVTPADFTNGLDELPLWDESLTAAAPPRCCVVL